MSDCLNLQIPLNSFHQSENMTHRERRSATRFRFLIGRPIMYDCTYGLWHTNAEHHAKICTDHNRQEMCLQDTRKNNIFATRKLHWNAEISIGGSNIQIREETTWHTCRVCWTSIVAYLTLPKCRLLCDVDYESMPSFPIFRCSL